MQKNSFPWTHIEASSDPLSADVFIIKGEKEYWLYDAGASDEAFTFLESLDGAKNVIISHFHNDHSFNLKRISFDKAFVTSYSSKHINESITEFTKVDSDFYYEDQAVKIHIFELPSSHCKGCLGLELDEKYAFIGDAAYAFFRDGKVLFNAGLVKAEIEVLKKLKADMVILSHEKRLVYRKETIIRNLERVYSQREKDNPYIELKDNK